MYSVHILTYSHIHAAQQRNFISTIGWRADAGASDLIIIIFNFSMDLLRDIRFQYQSKHGNHILTVEQFIRWEVPGRNNAAAPISDLHLPATSTGGE